MDVTERRRLADLNFAEYFREGARAGSGAVREEHGVVLVSWGHPFPFANLAYRLDERLGLGDLVELGRGFFSGRTDGFCVRTRQEADGELAADAPALGLVRIFDEPVMSIDGPLRERRPPDGVTVRIASEVRDVREYAALHGAAYESLLVPPERSGPLGEPWWLAPHVAVFLAEREGEPVAASVAFLSHGAAGVYGVVTRADARRTGLGEIMTVLATNAGFALGARLVTLQASPMGEGTYRRLGFEEVDRYAFWYAPTVPTLQTIPG